MSEKAAGFDTLCIHAGQEPEPVTGAVAVPVFQTSTFVQERLGVPRGGYEYARTKNPTRLALERLLAALEGGASGHAFASGMAAITTTMLAFASAGDHVVVGRDIYGGTHRFFSKVLARFGVLFDQVDTSDVEAVRKAVRPGTRMIWAETPTNPTLRIADLAALAAVAGSASEKGGAKVRLAVDNTFATPFFQKPLLLGTDVVVHSTTKYLNGHSDSVGGAVVCADPADAAAIGFVQNAAGGVLSPFDAFLVMRGIKTLPVRMRAHDANGRTVAAWLERHPKVSRVLYPGLTSHPGHVLAARQMSGFGGMISFDLGSEGAARRMLDRVRICALAESLGGVESLISHPATMSHASVEPEERARRGVTPGLVRLSVGIEDVGDILGDLDDALKAV
ncbi:MAG: cystathionine gamma-synthase [Acidithiobacillales bacterium]